jgi:GT2 family glycosyltransferase
VGRDGTVQRFCARRWPTTAQLILQVAGWGESRWAESAWLHGFERPAFYEGPPAQTEAVAGAFMMARRDAFEEVGGFDQGFFLYGEDVDLCRRLKDAGGEVWYVPTEPVKHYTGGSRRTPNPLAVAASHRAAERYAYKWRGGIAGALVVATSAFSLAARRVACGVAGLANTRARAAGRFYGEALRLKRGMSGKP